MTLKTRLAWRNIWRHPRRTSLTLFAIAFAAAVLVFFIALQISSYSATINTTVSVFLGYMQVQDEDYLGNPQIRKVVSKPDRLRDEISKLDGIKAVSVRAEAFALVSSKLRTYGVQVVGVNPQDERRVSSIPGLVKEGRYLAGLGEREAVIGKSLATNLKVDVGDELTVLGQGKEGSLAATILTVVGIFESGSREIDRNIVAMPLEAFQEDFQLINQAHRIVIGCDRLKDVPKLKKKVASLLGDNLAVRDWDELMPGIRQAIELDMAASYIFFFSLVLIVTFSVANTFFMSVMERKREFSAMMALGMRPSSLSALVFIESLIVLALGLLFGICLGSLVVFYFGTYGFSIPGMAEVAKNWNLPAAIYPYVGIEALTRGPGVIAVTVLIAVIFPVLMIRKLDICSSIRSLE